MFAFRSLLALLLCVSVAYADPAPIDFTRDIRPILSNHCFRCHGPDASTRAADLRLDQAASALDDTDREPAVVPHDPAASQLIARVTSDDEDLRMPPVEDGEPLTSAQVELLRRWIQQGARYERLWSLRPIQRPDLRGLPPARTTIDRFVLARQREHRLQPNGVAAPETLLRRASLALIGLPPSLGEQAAFEQQQQVVGADANYIRTVDRLMASPHFGERWARPWLDIARYADSAGYAQDPARTIWRYRDWVIAAFNRSLPYDRFTIEQLAGDLLPRPTDDQLLATAFHRNTMTNSEGGTDDEEFRNAAVVDRVNTTMQAWMGLTFGCAQCHDHKYDDISQLDYYRLFAIFNNTADADRGDEAPWLEEFTAAQLAQRRQLQAALKQLADSELADGSDQENHGEADKQQASTKERKKQLQQQLDKIRGIRTPIFRELSGDKRRVSFVHIRGDFRSAGETVSAGIPDGLGATPPAAPDRLALAKWLTDPANPLTARVIVNRYWELLFGWGLVTTSEDFGVQGELPSHPQLLDYLAYELIQHGWDLKWLVREMVLSDAYRRSSDLTAELQTADPHNRWLARGPRFRLPAELIRDQALAVGGVLSRQMNGPSVRPPQPKSGLKAAFGGSTDWDASPGADRFRRGLYTSWRRTTPYPSMTTFDAPSREACTLRRTNTNTPLQALVTLNDPVYVEAAAGLATCVIQNRESWASRLDLAFRLTLARPATPRESQRLQALHGQVLAHYVQHPDAATKLLRHATKAMGANESRGDEGVSDAGPSETGLAEHAAWVVVANVLLNLDETLAPR